MTNETWILSPSITIKTGHNNWEIDVALVRHHDVCALHSQETGYQLSAFNLQSLNLVRPMAHIKRLERNNKRRASCLLRYADKVTLALTPRVSDSCGCLRTSETVSVINMATDALLVFI